ncbi:MAG: hypothetical protein M3N18_10100 [Actinomycetota bacterium]|nr:hypothetical protein [Actinomycetota bacterium]
MSTAPNDVPMVNLPRPRTTTNDCRRFRPFDAGRTGEAPWSTPRASFYRSPSSRPEPEPAPPMLRIEPALPMLKIEPALPMLRIEPTLPMLKIEPALPMLKMLPTLRMLPTLLMLKMLAKLFVLNRL